LRPFTKSPAGDSTVHSLPSVASLAGLFLMLAGCADPNPGNDLLPTTKRDAGISTPALELGSKLSDVINSANSKYQPLKYEYNENLLDILDRVEIRLSSKSTSLDPLPLPRLDEAEQLEHFQETIKRWSEQTKLELRGAIDPLKAEIAARKPGGSPFHPEFQKKFAAVFDAFIPIEVEEMRDRRNKAVHDKANVLFDEYRETAPDAVREHEKTLNEAPYK
jgi:hypothetical protein